MSARDDTLQLNSKSPSLHGHGGLMKCKTENFAASAGDDDDYDDDVLLQPVSKTYGSHLANNLMTNNRWRW